MEVPSEEADTQRATGTTRTSTSRPPTPPSPTESELEIQQISTAAGLHKLYRDRLPTAESPPNYVRLWLGGYFTYRGLDPVCGDRFFWSGAEFMDLALPQLVEAFRAKLMGAEVATTGFGSSGVASMVKVTEAEVEMMGVDVYNFIQSGKASSSIGAPARIIRIVSPQATLGERLDAFLLLAAVIVVVLMAVLLVMFGLRAYIDPEEAVSGLLLRARLMLGNL